MVQNLSFFNEVTLVTVVDMVRMKGIDFSCDVFLWYFIGVSLFFPYLQDKVFYFPISLRIISDMTVMRDRHVPPKKVDPLHFSGRRPVTVFSSSGKC